MTSARTLLVLGGVRAGKSAFAVARARALAEVGGRVAVVVTAEPLDADMAARIARHRADRPPDWVTVEAPRRLGEALADLADRAEVVVVDCLNLWVANLLGGDPALSDEALLARVAPIAGVLARRPYHAILVSNEVGGGVHPETGLGRRFRDALGLVNQSVARAVDEAVLVVAGHPLWLKGG